MHTLYRSRLSIRSAATWLVALAALTLGWMPGANAQTQSASVCAPASGSSTGGAKVCAFDSPGLAATVLSATTLATPLAISYALGSVIAGRTAPGVSRAALDGSGQTGKAAAGGDRRWSGWFSLAQNQVGYSFQPVQSSGNVNLALGGIDYTFNNNVILGIAASWDRARVSTTFNGGNLNGNGYTLAPYVAVPFGGAWVFDASAGFGRANLNQVDNSVAGGVSGNSTDRRTFSALGLSYAKAIGKWQLTGKGNYLAAEDKVGSFTLSNGTAINANTTRLAQFRLGGQAAYDAGTFVPFVGLYYVNDIQRPTQAPVGGVSAANDRDGWLVQLGMNFYSKGPISGGLIYSTETSRSEVKNNQFMANIAIRF